MTELNNYDQSKQRLKGLPTRSGTGNYAPSPHDVEVGQALATLAVADEARGIVGMLAAIHLLLAERLPERPKPVDPWDRMIPFRLLREEILHTYQCHPEWEYDTTEGRRKDHDGEPPEGDGWELNLDAGTRGWDRDDYVDTAYWRRPRQADIPTTEGNQRP